MLHLRTTANILLSSFHTCSSCARSERPSASPSNHWVRGKFQPWQANSLSQDVTSQRSHFWSLLFIFLFFLSVIILLYTSYLYSTTVFFNPVSGAPWPACMSPASHYPYYNTTRKRFSMFQYEVCGRQYAKNTRTSYYMWSILQYAR